MHEFIGRLSVRVGTFGQIRVGKRTNTPYIPVYGSADRGLFGLHKEFLVIIQFPVLSAVLLQDNQITAHLRTRIFRKEVVWQTGNAHKIGMVHHILAYGRIGRSIQHPLRGNERHDSAFTHRIKAFQKEVVMYRPRRRVSCGIMTVGKFWVEHRHITKGDIGYSQIKMVHERLFNFLVPLYPYFLVGMQVFQYLARHQVFLKSHDVRVRLVL